MGAAEKKSNANESNPTESTVRESDSKNRQFGFTRGDSIGRYRLLEVIGEGGFGIVWKAEQLKPMRRVVALKLIKPGMDSKSVLARFEAERQALAVMSHPSIAKVLDGGSTDSGYPYFVMELVKGEPITVFCDRQRHSIKQRLNLFVDVCAAVQHAHLKGIIHRDLKPSNILVEYDALTGKPKPMVIDFGVAKALNQRLTENTMYTARGQIIGTPEYVSPEQAEMSAVDIDTRSDIYSLGVILYELLTGQRPFELERASLVEIQRIIRNSEPPRPSTRCRQLGSGCGESALTEIADMRRSQVKEFLSTLRGDLDWVVVRCLEKDRDRRYQVVRELAEDIANYLANRAVLARPPSWSYRARKLVSRHRVPVLAASVVLLMIVIAVFVSVSSAIEQNRLREIAVNRQGELVIALDRAEEAEKGANERAVEAQHERDVAQRVVAFLDERVLGQIDPDRSGSAEASARDLIDGAAQYLTSSFDEDPQVESRLQLSIGTAYARLAQRDQAIFHLERAAELLRSLYGEDSLEYAEYLRSRAWLDYWSGLKKESLAAAYQCLVRAHEISTNRLGEMDPLTQRDLGDVAMFKQLRDGKVAAGFDDLTMSMVANLRGRGETPEEARAVLLAVVRDIESLQSTGRTHEAERLIHDFIRPVRENALLADRIPEGLGGFTALLTQQNRLYAAQACGQYGLKWGVEHLGGGHRGTLTSAGNLVYVCWKLGDLEQAEAILREVLPEAERVNGESSSLVKIFKREWVKTLYAQGKVDEAGAYLEQWWANVSEEAGSSPDSLGAFGREIVDLLDGSGEPEISSKIPENVRQVWAQRANTHEP